MTARTAKTSSLARGELTQTAPDRLTRAAQAQAQPVKPVRRAPRPNRLLAFALVLFAASVPLDAVPLVGSLGMARVFGLLLGIAALTQPTLSLRRPTAAFWMFSTYLAIALISATPHIGWYGGAIQQRGMTLIQNLIMFWIVSNTMRDEDLSGRALTAMSVVGGAISVMMTFGFLQTSVQTTRGLRLSFAGANPNFVGGVLSLCLLAVLGLVLTARVTGTRWRWMAPALAVPILASLVRTGSRGALAGLFGGLVILTMSGERATRRFRNLALLLAASAASYFALYVTSITRARWGAALEEREVSGRERIYPELLKMLSERPIQGWGFEAHRRELGQRVPQLSEGALDAHNLYLHVLTEVGIVGSIPFWIALGLCVRGGLRARTTRHGLLPLVLVTAILISNLVTTGIISKPFWFVMAYAVAAGATATAKKRRAALSDQMRQDVERALASVRGN